MDQYNTWSFEAGVGKCRGQFDCRDSFFADPYAARLYKAHIKALISRVNTFNGRTYADDPTILGWNLMNEPRSTVDLVVEQRQAATGPVYNITKNSGDTLQRWIEDMAQYVKRRGGGVRGLGSGGGGVMLLPALSASSSSARSSSLLSFCESGKAAS